MVTINAGDPLLIELGVPMSTNGKEVNVDIIQQDIDFINFDKNDLTLSIERGIIKNKDTGIYTLKVLLTEEEDDLSETYTIRLTILESIEKPQCKENEELICFDEILNDQEIETCQCE